MGEPPPVRGRWPREGGRHGRRVVFFTDTAVTVDGKNVSFYIEQGIGLIDGGAGMGMAESGRRKVEVRSVDLARWFLKEVVGRSLPAQTVLEPRVLMKVDVEGADMDVMDRLFRVGGLCHIHTLYYEAAHTTPEWVARMTRRLKARGCPTVLLDLDDETGQGGEAFLKPESPYFLPLPDVKAASTVEADLPAEPDLPTA